MCSKKEIVARLFTTNIIMVILFKHEPFSIVLPRRKMTANQKKGLKLQLVVIVTNFALQAFA